MTPGNPVYEPGSHHVHAVQTQGKKKVCPGPTGRTI